MKGSWKKKVMPTLLATTLTFSFGAAVQADQGKGNNGKGHGKDKVEEKKEQKSDKKPVTKLESVMSVMELLEDELELETDHDYSLHKDIPSWAEDYVELALDYDIVSQEELEDFKKPASRLFVTKLLVNALGTDIDDVETAGLPYPDIKKLSDEEKAYISFALEEDLIAKYEKEKAFKPNKPVTHGEMEDFIETLAEKIDDEDINFDRLKKGTIEDIYKNSKEIKIESTIYDLSNDVSIRVDGNKASFTDLEIGMEVRFSLDDKKIDKIWAYTEDVTEDISFKVQKVSEGNDDGDFEEAAKTGERVSETTPDLRNENLYIRLNDSSSKKIDLEELDGSQEDGYETADLLEEAIEDALNLTNRVNVSFDYSDKQFTFETNNSPNNAAPSIQFLGDDEALEALGLDDFVTVGSLNGKESWTISIESDAIEDERYLIEMKINKTEYTETFFVDEEDTAEEIAEKLQEALNDNDGIDSFFSITTDDEMVTLTAKRSDDVDIKIEITED